MEATVDERVEDAVARFTDDRWPGLEADLQSAHYRAAPSFEPVGWLQGLLDELLWVGEDAEPGDVPPLSLRSIRSVEATIRDAANKTLILRSEAHEYGRLCFHLVRKRRYFDALIHHAEEILFAVPGTSPAGILQLHRDLVHELPRLRRKAGLGARAVRRTSDIEKLRHLWAERWVRPFRGPSGRLERGADATLDDAQDRIQQFWYRWDELLDCLPALDVLRPALVDGLRRRTMAHVPVVLAGARAATAIPVFVTLALGTRRGAAPRLQFLRSPGEGRVVVKDSFRAEAQRALGAALAVWAGRHKRPREVTGPRRPVRYHYNYERTDLEGAVLTIDTTLFEAALQRMVNCPTVALTDRSVGLSVATAVVAELERLPGFGHTWATGSIGPGSYKRPMRNGRILPDFGDYAVDWGGATEEEVASPIVTKLQALVRQGVAGRILIPHVASEKALALLREGLDSVNQETAQDGQALGFHPVRVRNLSTHFEAALPGVAVRSMRFLGAPHLDWLVRETGPEDDAGLRWRASGLADSTIGIVASEHETAAEEEALALLDSVASLFKEAKTSRPHVLFFALMERPRAPETLWRNLLETIGLDSGQIDTLVQPQSPSNRARRFLEALQEQGPELLVLVGWQDWLHFEWFQRNPGELAFSFVEFLREVSRLQGNHRGVAAEVLGQCRVLVCVNRDASSIFDGYLDSVVKVDAPAPPFVEEELWDTVEVALESRSRARRLLLRLSAFPEEFEADGLFAAGASLEFQSVKGPVSTLRSIWIAHSDDGWVAGPRGAVEGRYKGPLLRDARGSFHLHPMLRRAAHQANHKPSGSLAGSGFARQLSSLCSLHIGVAHLYLPCVVGDARKPTASPAHGRVWLRRLLRGIYHVKCAHDLVIEVGKHGGTSPDVGHASQVLAATARYLLPESRDSLRLMAQGLRAFVGGEPSSLALARRSSDLLRGSSGFGAKAELVEYLTRGVASSRDLGDVEGFIPEFRETVEEAFALLPSADSESGIANRGYLLSNVLLVALRVLEAGRRDLLDGAQLSGIPLVADELHGSGLEQLWRFLLELTRSPGGAEPVWTISKDLYAAIALAYWREKQFAEVRRTIQTARERRGDLGRVLLCLQAGAAKELGEHEPLAGLSAGERRIVMRHARSKKKRGLPQDLFDVLRTLP